MRKQLILLLFVTLSVLSIRAYDFCVPNADGVTIYYNITSSEERTVAVTSKPSKYIGIVNIPSTVDYLEEIYTVTAISSNAFSYCDNLTSVTIPTTVIKIGDRAFYDCHHLASINIPNSVIFIGDEAFAYCWDLYSIDIPNSITAISNKTFYACVSLTYVTIPNSVLNIASEAFAGCKSLVSLAIPNSVICIEPSTFSRCTSLVSVIIPNSVTTIGDYAFEHCTSLASVTIPNSVTSLGTDAFYYCTSLASVTIPDSVVFFGSNPFGYCSGLEAFYGKYATEDNRCLVVDGVLISFAPFGISEYTIPDCVHRIGDFAFVNIESLSSVVISSSVTEIGHRAFYFSTVESVDIPNSVLYLEYEAFGYCYKIKKVKVSNPNPNNISLEDDLIFTGVNETPCVLYVPEGSKQLYAAATAWSKFNNIEEFTYDPIIFSAKNEDGVTIDYNMTSEANKTVSVVGADVTNIDTAKIPSSNGNDEYIGAVNIPSSVVYSGETYSVISINASAFENCTNLTSVSIPYPIKLIGNYAFSGCTNLQEVKVYSDNPANIYVDRDIFDGVPVSDCILNVPEGSKELYANKYPWSKFGNIQEYSGIESILIDDDSSFTVYGIDGRFVMQTTDKSTINNLPRGFYIVNGKKMVVR